MTHQARDTAGPSPPVGKQSDEISYSTAFPGSLLRSRWRSSHD